jgi:nicotinate-nucleotide--dimethylbenzimidazole phosphoribosyltransferase
MLVIMNKFSLERQAKHILNDMAKIPNSLGRLEEIATKVVQIQNNLNPTINKPALLLACADHNIVEEGVSASTSLITYQMVRTFQNGGGSCAIISKENNVDMNIYNIGMNDDIDPSWNVESKFFVRRCDDNPIKGLSMTRDEAITAINNGRLAVMELAIKGCNTVVLGEMGVGNTTTSSLLISSILDRPAQECVNRDICATEDVYTNKISFIERAKSSHEKDIKDIFDTLSCYGGLEIAFLTGAIIQSARENMLVLVDGFITTTALLIASKISPSSLDCCIACTKSGETTQNLVYNELDIKPLLDLNMSLGEGTGALTSVPIIKSAINLFNTLKSCHDSGVTNVHPHIAVPFPIGTTSYVIKDDIVNNLEYLTTLKEIEDIELVFFESKWPDSLPSAETIRYLKEISEKNNISYTVHLPYDVDISSDIESERLLAIKTWTSFINRTKSLPIHGYVAHVHIGEMEDDTSAFNSKDVDEMQLASILKDTEDSLTQILNDTEIDHDLLCLETLEKRPFDLMDMIDKLDLRIALDVGHMVRFKYYNAEMIRTLLPLTRIVHLHGVADGEDHRSLTENKDFDLDKFLETLHEYSRSDIVVTLEVFDKKKLLDSIDYLTMPKEGM